MPRISKTEYYLNMAMSARLRSTCLKRNYGCIIVKNDEIVSTGYNGAARGEDNCCDVHGTCPRACVAHNSGDYRGCPAVHAEQNAMISAPRQEMIGATMYLVGTETDTGETIMDVTPCPICRRMILNAGIAKVIGPSGEIDLTKD